MNRFALIQIGFNIVLLANALFLQRKLAALSGRGTPRAGRKRETSFPGEHDPGLSTGEGARARGALRARADVVPDDDMNGGEAMLLKSEIYQSGGSRRDRRTAKRRFLKGALLSLGLGSTERDEGTVLASGAGASGGSGRSTALAGTGALRAAGAAREAAAPKVSATLSARGSHASSQGLARGAAIGALIEAADAQERNARLASAPPRRAAEARESLRGQSPAALLPATPPRGTRPAGPAKPRAGRDAEETSRQRAAEELRASIRRLQARVRTAGTAAGAESL